MVGSPITRSRDAGVFGRPLPIGMAMMKDACLEGRGETPGDKDNDRSGWGGWPRAFVSLKHVTITDFVFLRSDSDPYFCCCAAAMMLYHKAYLLLLLLLARFMLRPCKC